MNSNIKAGTFLRWTGSKKWLIKNIDKYVPDNFNNYHEVFLGGGSVFFHIREKFNGDKKFHLSDINNDLINCYIQIRDNPEKLIKGLKKTTNSDVFYYKIRNTKPRTELNKAIRFLYLNRTSFNGIYRVNSKGIYNVPYGKRKNVDIVTEDLLRQNSLTLQNVEIRNNSFEDTLKNVVKGDFVFLDPPYTVSHENNGFIEYNQKLFSWDDQVLLRNFILELNKKGVYFLLTNANHTAIKELYSDIPNINIEQVSRLCKIGGRNHTRKFYNELLIYNVSNKDI